MNYSVIIGIDPGINGAVAVLDGTESPEISIFHTPTWTESKVKKKKKSYIKHYDKLAMADILRPYQNRDTIVCIEKVGAMTGQGVTSMFSFGRGVGIWEGIIASFDMDYEEITPTMWKKEYGDALIQKKMTKPEEAKLTKAQLMKMKKTDKEKAIRIKKEYEAKKRRSKQDMKDEARELAIQLYPVLESELSQKKDSDKAEALLIAEKKRRDIYDQRK